MWPRWQCRQGRGDSVDRYESKEEEENTVLIHVLIHAYCVLMHRKFYITCISKPKYSNKVFSEKCLVKKKQLKKRDYVAFMWKMKVNWHSQVAKQSSKKLLSCVDVDSSLWQKCTPQGCKWPFQRTVGTSVWVNNIYRMMHCVVDVRFGFKWYM